MTLERIKNRLQQHGIRFHILVCFLGFVALMIVLLWFFQIIYLDEFYQRIKVNSIEQVAEKIEANISSDQLRDIIEDLAQKNDACISIYKIKESNGIVIYTEEITQADVVAGCVIHNVSNVGIDIFYDNTIKNGGETITTFSRQQFKGDENDGLFYQDETMPKSLVYCFVIEDKSGYNYFVLINCNISPVGATVSTLRIQLIWITVILVLLGLILSFIVTRYIVSPIAKINASAKKLGQGIFDLRFEGSGYREINELSNTLNYAAAELGRTEQLQQELIANISHDLRTPLTMIGGYAEMMRDLPQENNPENLQVIIEETQRLTSLVNDVLDISKLNAGMIVIEKNEYCLTESIRQIVDNYRRLLDHEGYEIVFNSREDVYIDADEANISSVVGNLLNNALTYTGDNKRVEIRQTVKGKEVRVDVIDNGEGISKELLPYIWQRYYRITGKHRRPAHGTGLGLSIVQRILELHGARYGVESKVGHGSDFWFALPFTKIGNS